MGIKSFKNASASSPVTVFSFLGISTLFPTTTQQKLSISPSATGAFSTNSAHHFFNTSIVSGALTSNINTAASAPRKKAFERLENRSCPAVSCSDNEDMSAPYTNISTTEAGKGKLFTHICKSTDSSGLVGCGRDFDIKSAPIVARYPLENRPEIY